MSKLVFPPVGLEGSVVKGFVQSQLQLQPKFIEIDEDQLFVHGDGMTLDANGRSLSPKTKLPKVNISAIRKGSAKLGRRNDVSRSQNSLDNSLQISSARGGFIQNNGNSTLMKKSL